MARVTREWVLRRRLAAQRLAAAPLPRAADAVRLLTAVQAQDAPLAAWSLGLRSAQDSYAAVLAEQSTGAFVRTHVLRPTWHLVAAEDLRWLLRATSAKVERGLAARHRQLGLERAVLDRALGAVEELVGAGVQGETGTQCGTGSDGGRKAPNRREVRAGLTARGLPDFGQQVGHILLVAELRGLVCSGPPRGTEHTYRLVEDAVPRAPDDGIGRDEALVRLTHRFIAGHGPASATDLRRWCGLTLAEIDAAASLLGDRVERVELDGQFLWFDPSVPARTTREDAAYLLPTFDEAALTYPRSGFPRRAPEADRTRLVSESGGGIVVVGGQDVGVWKRVVAPGGVLVTVHPEVALTGDDAAAVTAAAQRLGAFVERPVTVRWS